jgi:hypothetical protein
VRFTILSIPEAKRGSSECFQAIRARQFRKLAMTVGADSLARVAGRFNGFGCKVAGFLELLSSQFAKHPLVCRF